MTKFRQTITFEYESDAEGDFFANGATIKPAWDYSHKDHSLHFKVVDAQPSVKVWEPITADQLQVGTRFYIGAARDLIYKIVDRSDDQFIVTWRARGKLHAADFDLNDAVNWFNLPSAVGTRLWHLVP